MQPKVFISYSSVDEAVARQLAAVLEEIHVEYFFDRKDIDWGDAVVDRITRGLAECSALIVIVSPASLKSHWVPFEIGHAIGLKKRILPFLTHPSLDLPGYLQTFHFKTQLTEVKDYLKNMSAASADLSLGIRLIDSKESFYCHTVGVKHELTGTVFVIWAAIVNRAEVPISIEEYSLVVGAKRLPHSVWNSGLPHYANCTYVRLNQQNDAGRILNFTQGWSTFEFDPVLNPHGAMLQGGTSINGSLIFWMVPPETGVVGDQNVIMLIQTSRGDYRQVVSLRQIGV